ncbi:hypothetical protein J0X19_12855 [Hymenobacter sp. BT186]|uniref:Uncharacterized protein n=2 Tax=Hymenobacter telluris TaxID=2816474 RepID=A0A939J9I6_9BACT|nr:hypothetical protein [Hymenobacter telluris]MBW3374865.1 hypothetical protein [Hymenobacter norwichensis]
MMPLAGQAAGVVFQQISVAEYQREQRATQPSKTTITFPVWKKASQLTIPTTKGPLVLQDILIGETEVQQGHSEAEHTLYTYRGYLAHFHRHLVEVGYYETTQWWLIAENGLRLTLWGKPVYAPDQNSIVAICAGLDYSGGQPNVVQLLQIKNGVLQKVWEMRPTSWEPREIFWASPTSLYLRRESYGGSSPVSSYWKLTIT